MKNLEVFLRQFEPPDLEEVLKIERLSFAIEPWPASRFKYYVQHQPEGFVVAEVSDKVVGYVVGSITDQKGKIASIAVDPKYRREGVGQQLAAWILNYFKEKKIRQVQAEARTTNEGSIRFFQSFHFEIVETLKKYYPDGADAYLMELKLD